MKGTKRHLEESSRVFAKKPHPTEEEIDSAGVDTDDNNDIKAKRRSVACKACHSLKVKCVPMNSDEAYGMCIRCKKGKKHCEFDLTGARKKKAFTAVPMKTQMKGLKSEVEELKRELEAKDKIIKHQKTLIENRTQDNSPIMDRESATGIENNDSRLSKFEKEMSFLRLLNETTSMLTPSNVVAVAERRVGLSSQKLDSIYQDMVTSMGLTDEQCERMIRLFVAKVYIRFPFVKLPDNLNLDFLRQNDPLLLTLICYISTIVDTEPSDVSLDMQLHLESLISQTIAMDVLVIGSKTLQLLKTMLLYCIWYIPPELFHHRRYHLYIMICASLINDLGLTEGAHFFYSKEESSVKRNALSGDVQTIETKSINLVVYFMIISISLILRRKIPVQWNDYLNKACVALENTNERCYTLISFYARLGHLLERIHYTTHSANEIIGVLELSGSRYKHIMNEFQCQLNIIRQQIKLKTNGNKSDYNGLMAYSYSVQAYLYEPIIYSVAAANPETLAFLEDGNNFNFFSNTISLTTESCTLAMKYFLNLELDEIAVNPMFHSARLLYTSGLLLRLRYLTLTLPYLRRANVVTDSAMSVVKDLSVRVYEATKKYPKNHFLGKMKLVLGLYTHTCLSQWMVAYNNAKEEEESSANGVPITRTSSHSLEIGLPSLARPATGPNLTKSETPNSNSSTPILPHPPHLVTPNFPSPLYGQRFPQDNAKLTSNFRSIPPIYHQPTSMPQLQESRVRPSFSSLLNDQQSPQLQQNSPNLQQPNSSGLPLSALGNLMNGQSSSNINGEFNPQSQFYALSDEFWNDLFTGCDKTTIDYDMSTFMSDPSAGLM